MYVELSEKPNTVGELDEFARTMVKKLHDMYQGTDGISPACQLAQALNPIGFEVMCLPPETEVTDDLTKKFFDIKSKYYDPYTS